MCFRCICFASAALTPAGNMFGGGGGGGRPKPRKTRSQYRRELTEFYKRYAMDDKLDGVDAALDKWKVTRTLALALTRTLALTLALTSS